MSVRTRDSGVPSSSRPSGPALPAYESPAFPLNPDAQRKLGNIARSHQLAQLEKKLKEAQAAVSESAADINDRLQNREVAVAKYKRRKQNDNAGDGDTQEAENFDRDLEELRDKVDRMTDRMEASMRKLIDGQHNLEFITSSLEATTNDARANASTQASTQGRSQRRTRSGAVQGESDDDEGDEEYQDFTPTDPTGGTQNQPAPIDTFRLKLDNAKIRHQSHSLTARYAQNNDYVNFRRVVHDARHGDDEAAPLPNPSEWFAETDAPAPGVTTRSAANAADEDSDDDIAVSRATISTKCPLTLQEFRQPLTSKSCPHSFESEAILSMINASQQRIRQQPGPRGNMTGGEKAVRCPVGGCQAMLAKSDLQSDPVLIRKIKRLQRAKELEEEDADDDDGTRGATQRNATYIDDEDDDDGADIDALLERQTQPVKKEPRGTAPPSRTPARSVPASQGAVDIGSDSEEGDEEMEDE